MSDRRQEKQKAFPEWMCNPKAPILPIVEPIAPGPLLFLFICFLGLPPLPFLFFHKIRTFALRPLLQTDPYTHPYHFFSFFHSFFSSRHTSRCFAFPFFFQHIFAFSTLCIKTKIETKKKNRAFDNKHKRKTIYPNSAHLFRLPSTPSCSFRHPSIHSPIPPSHPHLTRPRAQQPRQSL